MQLTVAGLLEQTFIFVSNLSCRTRLNSCTSCCRNESKDFHPNDFVSSVVPDKKHSLEDEQIPNKQITHQQVDQMSEDDKTHVEVLTQRFLSGDPPQLESDILPR